MNDSGKRATRERSQRHYRSEHPNFPEVSGTTLPLLATVLAGFAFTIIVQLILRPEASGGFPTLVSIAVVAFLLSTLFFLSSTFFAINAQSNNYLRFLELDEAATNLLRVDDVKAWLEALERQWHIYHRAALVSFYGGIALLLAAIDIILWEFMGALVAGIFLAAVTVSLGVNVWVGLAAERSGQSGDEPDS